LFISVAAVVAGDIRIPPYSLAWKQAIVISSAKATSDLSDCDLVGYETGKSCAWIQPRSPQSEQPTPSTPQHLLQNITISYIRIHSRHCSYLLLLLLVSCLACSSILKMEAICSC
jgi:hypothetical protein